jgi:hypothetical protein
MLLLVTGCGGAALESQAPDLTNPAFFRAGVSHRWFPLEPGRTWTYEGEEEGLARTEVLRTEVEPRPVGGVACVAVAQEVWLDGVLVERATEWYAQDLSGAVWKFGEEAFVLEDGAFLRSPDSWEAGVDGLVPWRAFPAQPRPGDRIVGNHAIGQDDLLVVSLSATAEVPAGSFAGCLHIVENPEDPEDSDVVLYAPGVGRVVETGPGARSELVGQGGG